MSIYDIQVACQATVAAASHFPFHPPGTCVPTKLGVGFAVPKPTAGAPGPTKPLDSSRRLPAEDEMTKRVRPRYIRRWWPSSWSWFSWWSSS